MHCSRLKYFSKLLIQKLYYLNLTIYSRVRRYVKHFTLYLPSLSDFYHFRIVLQFVAKSNQNVNFGLEYEKAMNDFASSSIKDVSLMCIILCDS